MAIGKSWKSPVWYRRAKRLLSASNCANSSLTLVGATGIPFNDTNNPRLQIAELSEAILGGNLGGFQLGNEPDLYAVYVFLVSLIPILDSS